jgi:starvation-inducible DNA-binding protein
MKFKRISKVDNWRWKIKHIGKSGDEMLQELIKDHEKICIFLRDRIALASNLSDEGTADLLIQRLRAHEKSAWMVRSQLILI